MLQYLTQRFAAIARNSSGGLTVAFALALPAAIVGGGGAIDYGRALQGKLELQTAADAARVEGAVVQGQMLPDAAARALVRVFRSGAPTS